MWVIAYTAALSFCCVVAYTAAFSFCCVVVEVCGSAAWDVALNFIERWNHHISDLQLEGYDPIAPVPLLPQTAEEQGTLTCQVRLSR